MTISTPRSLSIVIAAVSCLCLQPPSWADTQKPVLHGKHWVAITGKPLAATAGARTFLRGGNAVDAACAMLAATSTMWDVLGWGGETQALIYNPNTGEVIGINALGVAPTGATPEFFKELDMKYPPQYGPLAAVTPGTPGGLMTMLAEYGTMSLAGFSITISSAYDHQSGSMTIVGSSMTVRKNFAIEGGTLTVGGSLLVQSTVNINGGALNFSRLYSSTMTMENGDLRVLPWKWDTDGAFASRLRRF